MNNSPQALTITPIEMLNIPDIRRRRDRIGYLHGKAETEGHISKVASYMRIAESAPNTIADIDALLAFIDGEQQRHANAITAAEQRGRVAGLLKAARTMCPECADGCPAIRSGQGRWHHPVAGTTTHCHAGAIHALIAEEARSE